MNALRRAVSQQLRALGARTYASTSNPERKVAVLGAGGGIGQPLSLLMKINPNVSSLALYDVVGTPGVAADISHINSKAQVKGGSHIACADEGALRQQCLSGLATDLRCITCDTLAKGYTGDAELAGALEGADLVIIPAGVPRKPGMTRDDLFNINAGIVRTLITGVAEHCPKAILNIISNPVNSTVPIAAAVLKAKGVYDPKRLFGVTTLDLVRAKTFYAEAVGEDVGQVDVPVVGGHAGVTILPLFSQASPYKDLGDEKLEALTRRTQDGGTEVVQAKAGKGSATLSMAYAGALFAEMCLRGLNGEPNVEEYAFVQSTVVPGLPFFSSKVKLGPTGAERIYDLGDLTDYEKAGLELLKPELKASIDKGTKWAEQGP